MKIKGLQIIAWQPFLSDGQTKYLWLEADTESLLRWLGEKAKQNASGSAHDARGDIQVRIKERKPR